MFIVLAIASLVALTILFDGRGTRNHQQRYQAPGYPPHGPHFGGGPVFSPHGRYIWDGHRWVRNENNLGAGMILGIAVALGLAYLFY